MMACTQCYYLIIASIHIPYFPYSLNRDLVRYDCISSGKGGKRPGNAIEVFDINPCFCHSNATCTLLNGTIVPSESCPLEGATCHQGENMDLVITSYISNKRDCMGGAGIQCSREQPCDPCERDELALWGSGRCRTCYSDFRGDCHFTPDRGPWCRKAPGSKDVVPCKTCCTEKTPLLVDGICY